MAAVQANTKSDGLEVGRTYLCDRGASSAGLYELSLFQPGQGPDRPDVFLASAPHDTMDAG